MRRRVARPVAISTAEGGTLAATDAVARLFIALWPSDAERDALIAAQDGWVWSPAARRTPAANLHVTLHFLGDVATPRVDALTGSLALAVAPFRLVLSRASVWRNGIAALEPDDVPPALVALHAALGARLDAAGIAVEARPYRPHVTLARDATGSRPAVPGRPIELAVDAYALVRSRGGRYRSIARHGCEATRAPESPTTR